MRVSQSYIKKTIAGSHVVVPVGKASLDFRGVITLNDTASLIWEQLSCDECTAEDLVACVSANYNVTEAIAQTDVSLFLDQLREVGALIDES